MSIGGYDVGEGFIQIVPSFSGVVETIGAEAENWAQTAAQAFSETFKSIVDARLKTLDSVQVPVETSEALAKIQGIQAEIESIRSNSVEVGVSDADAQARLAELQAELILLADENPTIKVNVDTGEATLEMAALGTEATALGGGLGGLGSDASGASGGLGGLGAAAGESSSAITPLIALVGALVVALIPLGGVALGGLAALPTIFTGAATGAAALYLGLSGVVTTIMDFNKTKLTTPGGSASSQASSSLSNASSERSAANAVVSAQEALNNARVNGARAVTTAEANAAAAGVAAAKQVQAAQQQLVSAEDAGATSVANAEANAAQARVTALANVASAEATLVTAQRAAVQAIYTEQQAQVALTAARQAAQFQLTNYADQLKSGAIAQEQAALTLAQAKDALTQATQPGSTATLYQQEQAQISYEQAAQAVQNLNDQQSQLTITAGQAAAAGVDGNQSVVSATNALQNAQQNVIDTTNAAAAAQTNLVTVTLAGQTAIGLADQAVVTAQITAAQNIATAEQNLQDTTTTANANIVKSEQSVVLAKQQTAQSVKDARRALEQALAAQSDAFARAAIPIGSGGAALNTYATALAKLSPAGQSFVKFVTGTMFPVFDGLKKKTQDALLPLLQQGLTDLLPFFQALAPFITGAATGIGQTFDELAKFIGSKKGMQEMNSIFSAGNDFMSAMGGNSVTFFQAIGSIASQAGPIVKALASGITSMIDDFAKWAEGGGFEKFLKWLTTNGPGIVVNFENFAKMVGGLVVAITPVGVVLDDVLTFLEDLINVVNDPFGRASINWGHVWDDIKNWTVDAWDAIDKYVIQPMETFFKVTVKGDLDATVGFFTDLPGRVVTGIGDFAGTVWSKIEVAATWLETNIGKPVVNFFTDLPGKAFTALGDVGKTLWSGFIIGADWLDTHILTPISNFFVGLPGKIVTFAAGMWDGIAQAFKNALNDIIGWWDDLKFSIPAVKVGPLTIFPGVTIGVPNIPKFHGGGVVQGAPGVEQLAYLMPGEVVTPAGLQLPSSGGLNSSIELNLYGVDLSNAEAIKSVVTDAFTQFVNEQQRAA